MGLCDGSGIDFIEGYMLTISRIYAINVALDCLRDGAGNGIQPKVLVTTLLLSLIKRVWKITMKSQHLKKQC